MLICVGMKNCLISSINSNDLEGLRRLSEELGYPCSQEELQSRLELLKTLDNHALCKISEDGELRGWIHLEKVFDLIEKTKVEIKAIVVSEKYRSRGYGKGLIEYAKNWAQENGIDTIYLSCNIVRNRTHEFYKREGFALVKTSHFFELEL